MPALPLVLPSYRFLQNTLTPTHIIAFRFNYIFSQKSSPSKQKLLWTLHFGYPLLFLIWIAVTLTKYGFISTAIIVLDVAFPSASAKILIKSLYHHHIKRIVFTSTISAHIMCILTIEGEVFPSFCCLLFVLEVLHYPIIRRAETFFWSKVFFYRFLESALHRI